MYQANGSVNPPSQYRKRFAWVAEMSQLGHSGKKMKLTISFPNILKGTFV